MTAARLIAAHGRHYLAETAGGERVQAFARGKKTTLAVGDRVRLAATAPGQAVIETVDDRTNLVHRSDQFKSKLLAANVDQLLIVLATEPGFSEDLLGRALVAAESLGIAARILLNKTDLVAPLPRARERLAPYRALGYPVDEISVHAAPGATLTTLRPQLAGRTSLLLGQSGMGKSSLLNLLVPDADADTREISAKLDSGKHTTTFTRLYDLPGDWGESGALIDSPGFQEFGLHHLGVDALPAAFPEFAAHLGGCRFYNCTHLHEPDCAILAARDAGQIDPRRHQLYAQLRHEALQQKPY